MNGGWFWSSTHTRGFNTRAEGCTRLRVLSLNWMLWLKVNNRWRSLCCVTFSFFKCLDFYSPSVWPQWSVSIWGEINQKNKIPQASLQSKRCDGIVPEIPEASVWTHSAERMKQTLFMSWENSHELMLTFTLVQRQCSEAAANWNDEFWQLFFTHQWLSFTECHQSLRSLSSPYRNQWVTLSMLMKPLVDLWGNKLIRPFILVLSEVRSCCSHHRPLSSPFNHDDIPLFAFSFIQLWFPSRANTWQLLWH